MKNILYIYLILFSFCLEAQTDKKYTSKKARYDFYNTFAKKYNSATIQEIWNADKKQIFDEYVVGTLEKNLIDDYSTVIHELLHSYNESTFDGHTYFVESGQQIYVPYTEIYNSKELNKYVKQSVQDSIFRYGLYVGGETELIGLGKVDGLNNNASNEVMSIQKGIYGLVEEFSAYYFGGLAAFESYDYYVNKFGKDDIDAWNEYEKEVKGEIVAYYEFQLFIAWYLTFAKEKHPKMYEAMHKNKQLKAVFTIIDDKYLQLIQDLENVSKNLPKEKEDKGDDGLLGLSFDGSDADFQKFIVLVGLTKEQVYSQKEILTEIKKEYVSMGKEFKKQVSNLGGKNSKENNLLLFFGSPDKQYVYLQSKMTNKMSAELKKLRFEGLTPQNYKKFLE